MSFVEFLNKVFEPIPTLIKFFNNTLQSLMDNNFFKLLIYVIIFSFIIYFFLKIIDLIKYIFDKKFIHKSGRTRDIE